MGGGGVGWGMLPSCSCYVGSLQKHRCFWPSGSIAGLPRSCVGKSEKKRFTIVACVLLTKHSVFTVYYIEWKHKKSPDCQHLQFSTHCQFIANNSAKVAWRKMPEKTQYICSILHDHAMTIRWKFTILQQNMRFLTSENMIYGTRWLCFKTDEKKWSVQHDACHYWKIGKLPRRQLFFSHVDTQTQLMASENLSPLAYIYIYMCMYISGSGWCLKPPCLLGRGDQDPHAVERRT